MIYKNPRLMKKSFPILKLSFEKRCDRAISSSARLKQIWLSLVLLFSRYLCSINKWNINVWSISVQNLLIREIIRKIINAVNCKSHATEVCQILYKSKKNFTLIAWYLVVKCLREALCFFISRLYWRRSFILKWKRRGRITWI